MSSPTEVSPQIVAFLDAYSVLPTFAEIREHLEVLIADTDEAQGILREDLVRAAKHLRSTLVSARAFMEAWDNLMDAAAKVEDEIPGTLVGGLLSEAVKLERMLSSVSEEMRP